MKKRLFSIFMALLMVAAVFAPLAVTANAASDPIVWLTWSNSEYGYTSTGYYPNHFSDISNKFSGAINASVSGTTVTVTLKDFHPTGVIGDYYGIHVQVPSTKWNVIVSATGDNRLGVHDISKVIGTSTSTALSTNGNLIVFAASATGSSLSVYSAVGTRDKQEKVTTDIYGLSGHAVDVGTLRPDTRLTLNVYFDLYLTGFTSRVIFPIHTDKGQYVTISHANYHYHHFANYGHYYDSDSVIKLASSTYFNTIFYTTEAPSQNFCYHTVTYMNTFTGIMNAELKNAILAGGPYGGHGVEGGKPMANVFSQVHTANYADSTYYHLVAKNCGLTVTQIPSATLKSAFSFPLAYGYTLPGLVERAEFYAVIQWTDQYSSDVTGKKVDYAKKYRAIITLVPKRQNIQSVNLNGDLPLIRPSGTYGGGVLENGTYAPKLYLEYTAVQRPALTITKQPANYVGSGTNKQARFSVDASDSSATYQWQKSTDKVTWTNITDKITTTGSTQITGSRAKNLTYDFNQVDVGTTLMYFRCVVSRASDNTQVTSNVVSYTYTASPTVVSEIVIGGFNYQPGARDGFYDSPYIEIDGKNANWSGGGDNYKVEIVEHFWYEGAAGAANPKKTADTNLAEGKTYTFRIKIKPVPGKSTFSDAMTAYQYSTGKAPDKIQKFNDGSRVIDFTFGPIGEVIRNVYLYNVVPPYNGMGFIDPTVRDDAAYKLDAGFTRGWFVPGTLNQSAGMPKIGEQYYMTVYLYAKEGGEFSAVNNKPSVSVYEMRDRDGKTISADKYEYQFAKKSDGSPDYRYLIITLTFTCKETHIMKGGVIKDLDLPTAGVPFDTDVTLETPQIKFQEMTYFINGEKVADPAKTAPEEGDIVEIRFTFTEYGEGETKMHFDKGIYTTWYIGGNESENGQRVYRDTSYQDENVAAFSCLVQVEKAPAPDFLLGDVDGDGEIKTGDARLALRRAIDLETYTPESREFKACDINLDGSVKTGDARMILRKAIGFNDPEWGVKQ